MTVVDEFCADEALSTEMWAKNYLLNTFKVMGVSKSAKQAKLRPLLVNYFQLADYFELKRELLSLSLSCPGLVLNQYY